MAAIGSLPAALQGWQTFYVLTGTAAATMMGLMFIAVTFGSSLATKETMSSARAFLDPTYMHFGQVLLTACLLVVPTIGPTFLGGALILIGAARLVGLGWVFGRYREAHRTHRDIELSDWVGGIVVPSVCHVVLIATGGAFLMREPVALTGIAVVTVSLLFVGIHGAWELVLWMAVVVGERRQQ